MGAEVFPAASSDSVLVIVRRLLSAVNDNSPTRNTGVVQDKILLGSGKMVKVQGICVGRNGWNCWARTSSAGLS